jgi:predicted ABC-type sugar transport system permease subunit
MNLVDFYELLGYSASVFVAISLMMRSVSKLRVINLVGATLFTIYGLMIGALPVAALNFFIVLVNLYYLQQFLRATPEPLKTSSQMLS